MMRVSRPGCSCFAVGVVERYCTVHACDWMSASAARGTGGGKLVSWCGGWIGGLLRAQLAMGGGMVVVVVQ